MDVELLKVQNSFSNLPNFENYQLSSF